MQRKGKVRTKTRNPKRRRKMSKSKVIMTTLMTLMTLQASISKALVDKDLMSKKTTTKKMNLAPSKDLKIKEAKEMMMKKRKVIKMISISKRVKMRTSLLKR